MRPVLTHESPPPPTAKDALYDTATGTFGSPTTIAGAPAGIDSKVYPGGTPIPSILRPDSSLPEPRRSSMTAISRFIFLLNRWGSF